MMGRTRDRRGQPKRQAINPATLQKIVVEGQTQVLVEEAQTIGKQLADDKLKTSQIRNVFGTARQIEMNWPRQNASEAQQKRAERQLLLLKPKLAYQSKRNKPVQRLRDVLDEAINLVQGDRERFQNFMDFFEAILAYHQAAGGEN